MSNLGVKFGDGRHLFSLEEIPVRINRVGL